ncbi:hypothetical protein TNCV_2227431 [Trichonephila clavipes]|uniref:Uncharacterized protein n=1 Tax=Trichonephila clavipes TaxID=2585209 RepID=A0A8X6WEN9_TRICX|nr:hypothetical protein TNCV_2227431 [Trichonephila clavipes]
MAAVVVSMSAETFGFVLSPFDSISSIVFGELSPIPKTKTTSVNRGGRKNVKREQTSAEGLASTKRVAKGCRSKDAGGKRRAIASTSKHNESALVLFVVLNIRMKIKNRYRCNVVAVVHLSLMRDVSI